MQSFSTLLSRISPTLLILVSVLVLSACGGGGGGDSSSLATGSGGSSSSGGGNGTAGSSIAEVSLPAGMGQALLGPIVNATVRLYREGAFNGSAICTTSTTSANAPVGPGVMDLSTCSINPALLYLINISGGADIDVNDDGIVDNISTPNRGSIRGLIKGEDILAGDFKVNILTEIAYQQVSDIISTDASGTEIIGVLNQIIPQLITEDINGDGIINVSDLIRFSPRRHQEILQSTLQAVRLRIIEAILNNDQTLVNTLSEEYIHAVIGKYEFVNFLENPGSYRNFLVLDLIVENGIIYLIGTDRDADDFNLVTAVIDVSEPGNPIKLDEYSFRDLARSPQETQLRKNSNTLYISSNNIGLFAVDISNPSSITASLLISNANVYAVEVFNDSVLYLSYFNSSDNTDNLSVYDITTPFAPSLISTIPDQTIFDMQAKDGFLYASPGATLFSLSSPTNPTFIDYLGFPSSSSIPIAVQDGFLYTASLDDGTNGLKVVNMNEDEFGAFENHTNLSQPIEIITDGNSLYVVVYIDHTQAMVLIYNILSPGNLVLESSRLIPPTFYLEMDGDYFYSASSTFLSIIPESAFSTSSTTNGNSAPAFTSSRSTTIDEERNFVFYTATAIDVDGDSLTFSIESGDKDAFTIDSTSGELRPLHPLDFENPSDSNRDNFYELLLKVSDGQGGASFINFIVDILDVDDAAIPVFTSASTVLVSDKFLDPFYTVMAENTYNDEINFVIGGGDDQELFSIDWTGQLSFASGSPPSFETPIDANGDGIYEVEIRALTSGSYLVASEFILYVTIVDKTELNIRLGFPTNNANLGGVVSQTVISGSLTDLSDNLVSFDDLDYIDLNGEIFATQDLVNPALWRGTLPLPFSNNDVNLTVRDADGNEHTISPSFRNTPVLTYPYFVTLDEVGNYLYISDLAASSIYRLDMDTDHMIPFSGPAAGSGPAFGDPTSMILDRDNNRLIVANAALAQIYAVDLDTGNRTLLIDTSGSGPDLVTPVSILWSDSLGRLLVMDQKAGTDNDDALLSINLDTNERSYISENVSIGSGLPFGNMGLMILDEANNRVVVPDGINIRLVAVDLTSGDRTTISDNDLFSGEDFQSPFYAFPGSDADTIFVPDVDNLLSVSLSTGTRTVVSGNGAGDGPFYWLSQGVMTASDEILILDRSMRTLYNINPANGERTVVYTNLIGIGPQINSFRLMPSGIVLDEENNRLLVASASYYFGDPVGSVISVDLANGIRSTWTDGGLSHLENPGALIIDPDSGDLILADYSLDEIRIIDSATQANEVLTDLSGCYSVPTPAGMILDANSPRLLFVDTQGGLVEVLTETGSCSLLDIFSDEVGAVWGLVHDADNNRVIFSDVSESKLYALNLSTYALTEFSSSTVGTGPEFNTPMGLFLDAENDLLYVADGNECALYIVDLNTGNRSYLSNHDTGAGPLFIYPTDLVVDTDNKRAFVVDQSMRGIFVVDLETGDRAVSSIRLDTLQ